MAETETAEWTDSDEDSWHDWLESDDEDFESYRDEKLREHEDWFRGER